MEEQIKYREYLLEWCNSIDSEWKNMKPRFSKRFDLKSLEDWEESCCKLKEKLQTDSQVDDDDFEIAKRLYDQWELLNRESHAHQEMEEQKKYREYLLEWCNNIDSHWESNKPRFSKLFDIKSLNEWEESCRELKEKLQINIKVDDDDFKIAKSLYEQWEQLYEDSQDFSEKVQSNLRKVARLPIDTDKEVVMLDRENNTVDELNKDWIEIIQIANNMVIPIEEIRNFLTTYKG